MKVVVNVRPADAIKQAHETFGPSEVEIDIKALTSKQRDMLARAPADSTGRVIRLDQPIKLGPQKKGVQLFATDYTQPAVVDLLLRLLEKERQLETEHEEGRARQQAWEREKQAWVSKNGSSRLKACLAEGIECDAIYRDERMAIERPCWFDLDAIDVDAVSEPRNPPAEALDVLAQAREYDTQCQLRYWEGSDRPRAGQVWPTRGYLVEAEFLGRPIVYFGDAEGGLPIPPLNKRHPQASALEAFRRDRGQEES